MAQHKVERDCQILEFSLVLATISDAEAIEVLEAASFPSDEAASLTSITYRIQHAPEYFYKFLDKYKKIVGFINGTCMKTSEITHDSMFEHIPDALTLVIHSVTIDAQFRNKGLGFTMLQRYIEQVFNTTKIESIKLLCKLNLRSWYKNAGFVEVGISGVHHGREIWYEMELRRKKE